MVKGWVLRAFLLTIPIFLPYIKPRVSTLMRITGRGRDWANKGLETCENMYDNILTGCEDLHLHDDGDHRVLFLLCTADMEKKKLWFPGMGVISDPEVGSTIRDNIFAWDLKTDKLQQLSINGFDDNFVVHGFDVISTSNENEVAIYAINHKTTGSVVEKFTHSLGSESVTWKQTFNNQSVVNTPNDIYVINEAKNIFYATNDHRYRSGFGRSLEDLLQFPTTYIAVHNDDFGGYRIVAQNIIGANGITGDRKETLYVSSVTGAALILFNYEPTGNLTAFQRVNIGFAPDNPSISVDTNELIVTGHPYPLELKEFAHNTEKMRAHSAVARIPLSQFGSAYFGGDGSGTNFADPAIDEFFFDAKAGVMNASTTAVVDAKTNSFFVTSCFGYSVARCRLDKM